MGNQNDTLMKESKEFERKEAFETELRLNISGLQIITDEFSHLFFRKEFSESITK